MQHRIATLQLVDGEGLARSAGVARVPSLEAQPFRPGELPESVVVELSAEAAQRAEAEAAAGVPAELWLRIATETARHVDAVAVTVRLDPTEVFVLLADAAATSDSPVPIEARRHRAYAAYLRKPRARRRRPARLRFELALPDQMLAGWSIDAARLGETLAEYVSVRAVRAPDDAVALEAAAAERGYSLGEWIYAAVVAAITAR
jgi:hypothetical protein